MRHRNVLTGKLIALFLIPLLLFLILFYDKTRLEKNRLDVPLLSEEEYAQLASLPPLEELDFNALTYQQSKVAFDRQSNTLYLPQDPDTDDWSGHLGSIYDSVTLYFQDDPLFRDKAASIRESHVFKLLMICDGKCREFSVIFTGLPAVCLWGQDYELSEFTLFDPKDRAGTGGVITSYCTFHWRGYTSAAFPKKGWRISLCDSDLNKKKANLLGMRNDDDWILNAMYSDPTKLRENLAYTLWEDINRLEAESAQSSQLEYVEFFLNGQYYGLYALMVPLDGKQLSLKEGDLMYRPRSYELATEEDFESCTDSLELLNGQDISIASITWPNTTDSYFSWEPYRLYQAYIFGDAGQDPLTDLGIDLDANNAVVYNWFYQLTCASDNTWKNTVIVIKRQPDNRYRLYHTVWDLDYTFGDTWTADSFSRTYFRPEDGELPPNTPMYVRCLKDDPESVQALSIQKWKSWNDAGITAEYLCNLADSEMEFLLKSGAFQRDSERWPECQNSSDLTQLKAWIQSRFSTLNRYFSKLGS